MSDHISMVLLGCVFLLLPLGFVAGCSWCVYIFPKRVQSCDTTFLHTYAFLFFRFKPEAYWFAIVFIVRNLLIALTPTLPDPITQVFCIVSILVTWLATSAMYFPWRGHRANYLDAFVVALTVMMLSISGFFVVDADPFVVAVLCSAIVGTIFMLAVVLVICTIAPHFVRMRVAFGHFICHHKGGRGAFARLLKVVLNEGSQKKVFIDCDDLKNLDKLFEYVGSHTETVVALMSKELLFRPWCIGELVTAHLNQPKVKMAPVIFPDYAHPDDKFIQDYASLVDVSDLGAHGIDIVMVQKMIEWLRELPALTIPAMINDSLMQEIRTVLTLKVFQEQVITEEQAEGAFTMKSTKSFVTEKFSVGLVESKVTIVADHMNIESLATGLVLSKLVSRQTSHEATMMPKFSPCGNTLPAITESCIFVLTNGVFMNPMYIQSLLEAAQLRSSCIPIFGDEGFRFPSKAMLVEIEASLPRLLVHLRSVPHLWGVEAGAVVNVIQDLGKEIAVVFSPQDYSSTETLLQLKAKDVAMRLLEKKGQALSLQNIRRMQSTDTAAMDSHKDELYIKIPRQVSQGSQTETTTI